MALKGGRDIEKDLFCNPGGYRTKASKLKVGTTCDECGCLISKEAYMGQASTIAASTGNFNFLSKSI